jgi:D12 class N6 adenine-specific DNA methyltransferase
VPSSLSRYFDALPSVLGGKRSLAPLLFGEIARAGYPPARGHVLLDPFMGAGSISIIGKALGYEVHANDVAERSEAVGRALIENDRVHLTRDEVAAAMLADPGDRFRPGPKRLPFQHDARELLVAMTAEAERYASPAKRALMRTLVVKAAVRIAMWGQLKSEGNRRIAERRYDRLTAGQATWVKTATRPRKQVLNELRLLDRGVFANGHRNTMSRGDVIDFLERTDGDVAYLDPPYPGTVAYEDEYVGIDELLLGREVTPDRSRFSARDGWRFLGDVFDAAERVPCWVLSLGNEEVTAEEVAELMRQRGREVEGRQVRYAHLLSQASDEKLARNEELILVAQRAAVRA